MYGTEVKVVYGQTFRVLRHACAALVTSGTATLEAALFGVPQVVCYYTACGNLISFLRRHLLKVKFISLVNLVAGREVVKELVADGMNLKNLIRELKAILPEGQRRKTVLEGYQEMLVQLGRPGAPERAAEIMFSLLSSK